MNSDNKRLDYFVVWGHGIPYLHKIVEIIDQHGDADILYIKKKKITDLKQFIQDIYSEEWLHVPKEHTISKTQFLYHVPRQVALILVMNLDPKTRIQDNKNPLFRMPESETIKDIKDLVRKKYDPNKGGYGKVQLITGYNPDQHVIHASDFPGQIQNALNIFEMNDVPYWERYWKQKYCPVGVPSDGQKYNVEEVSIDDIRMKILNENGVIHSSKIEDSPHYSFVCGDTAKYENYWERFCGDILKENHSPSSFLRLAQDLRYLAEPHQNNFIKVEKTGPLYYTIDGDHRLSILKRRGERKVKVEIVNA